MKANSFCLPYDIHPRWSGLAGMVVRLALPAFFLQGCALLNDGSFGADGSTLAVDRDKQCQVKVSQQALSEGRDDSKVAERVRVNSDCEVEIDFRQNVGDDADEALQNPIEETQDD